MGEAAGMKGGGAAATVPSGKLNPESQLRDNEIFYCRVADGSWAGDFDFRITDWAKFWGARMGATDRFWALLLHTACRVASDKPFHARMTAYPGRGRSQNQAEVKLYGLMSIYQLNGFYRLDEDGVSVDVHMHERMSPLPYLFQHLSPAVGRISEDGMRGSYERELFGSAWSSVYEVRADRQHVDVSYDCPWGKLTYVIDRRSVLAPPFPEPSSRQRRLLYLSRKLDGIADGYRSRNDLRAAFVDIYAHETYALAETIESRNVVRDPDWVVSLAEAFAQRFVIAADADEKGGYVPRYWALVFEAIRDRELTEVDALGLCMFAHIVGDLPHALCDVGRESPGGASHIDDFHYMNQQLANQLDHFQDQIAARYNPLWNWLDRIAGRLDETFVNDRVVKLRAMAWYTSSRLEHPEGVQRLQAENDIVKSTEKFISDILDPPLWPMAVGATVVRSVLSRMRRRQDVPPPATCGSREPAAVSARLFELISAHETGDDCCSALRSCGITHDHPPSVDHGLGDLSGRGISGSLCALIESLDDSWISALPPTSREGVLEARARLPFEARQREAIRRYQTISREARRRGCDPSTWGDLDEAARALHQSGVPDGTAPLAWEDIQGHTSGDDHVARVEVVLPYAYNDIAWGMQPQFWQQCIPEFEELTFVENTAPSDEPRWRAVVRESVNMLFWLGVDLTRFTNLLWVDVDFSAPGRARVDYGLKQSLDGKLSSNDGFNEMRALGEVSTLVVAEKKITLKSPLIPEAIKGMMVLAVRAMLALWVWRAAERCHDPEAAGSGGCGC